jgi:hypothetical protein
VPEWISAEAGEPREAQSDHRRAPERPSQEWSRRNNVADTPRARATDVGVAERRGLQIDHRSAAEEPPGVPERLSARAAEGGIVQA